MKISLKWCPVTLIICGLLLASGSLAENVNGSAYAEEGSPAPNSDFTILNTNSTISEPLFNRTSSAVTFNITGPSNTSGFIWCKISPNLIPDSNYLRENVKVFVDSNQINYMHSFNDGGCELYFNYTHSNHEIVISLPKENWTIFGVNPLIVATLLIAVVPLIALIMLYHRKTKVIEDLQTKRHLKPLHRHA
ncbi:MAG: hypothetical protein ACFCUE_12440 [Candidatus Bathyarchaeia archaeon]|jgi:hypothetical protein